MLPTPINTITSGATMPVANACGKCGVDGQRILHNVRHSGILGRLCTSCVLRLHTQCFCPTCFTVYHPSPPPSEASNDAVTCSKCYSSSHFLCVGPNPPCPYICPLCVNPSAPFPFLKSVDGKGEGGNNENCRAIDMKAAKILVAAARIAALSMSKAAMAARAEAEKMAAKAAAARKRAKESLERVTILAARDKMRRNATPLALSMEVSRTGGNVGGVLKERRVNNNSRIGNAGNGAMVVVGAVGEKNQLGNVESSNEVVTAFNVVELREKQKPRGFIPGSSSGKGVAMQVEENRGIRVSPSLNDSRLGAQNRGGGSLKERSGPSGHLIHPKKRNAQGEKVNNRVIPVPPRDDQIRGTGNGHAGGQKNNRSRQ